MPNTFVKQYLNSPKTVIIDQAIVSATNFITALLLARFLGIYEFGVYSILFIALILIDTFHHSLFSAPMMTLAQGIIGSQDQSAYFNSVYTVQTISSLVITSLLFVIGMLVLNTTHHSEPSTYLVPFILCSFVYPMQEWLRKYLFTNQCRFEAFYLDLTKSIIQIALLIYCVLFSTLTVGLAFYIIAFSTMVTYLIGVTNHKLKFSHNGFVQTFITNWQHGQHLLPSYLMEWIRFQGFMVIGGIFLGAQAVGAIRAAQNIMGPLNVIYQAVDNIFPVEGAKLLAKDGKQSMLSYFKTSGIKGISLLAIPCLIISVFSYWIMDALYGDPFTEFHTLIIWQALSVLIAFSHRTGSSFLRTINMTKPILVSSFVGSVTIIALIAPLSAILYENGIMLAKVAAEIISLLLIGHSINKYVASPQAKQDN